MSCYRGLVLGVPRWSIDPPHSPQRLDYKTETKNFFKKIEETLSTMKRWEVKTIDVDFKNAAAIILFTPHVMCGEKELSPQAAYALGNIIEDEYGNGLAWIDDKGEFIDYYKRRPNEKYTLISGSILNQYYDRDSKLIIPSLSHIWHKGEAIKIQKTGAHRFDFVDASE